MTHILEDSTHKIEGQPPQKRVLRGKAEGVGVERKHNSPVT